MTFLYIVLGIVGVAVVAFGIFFLIQVIKYRPTKAEIEAAGGWEAYSAKVDKEHAEAIAENKKYYDKKIKDKAQESLQEIYEAKQEHRFKEKPEQFRSFKDDTTNTIYLRSYDYSGHEGIEWAVSEDSILITYKDIDKTTNIPMSDIANSGWHLEKAVLNIDWLSIQLKDAKGVKGIDTLFKHDGKKYPYYLLVHKSERAFSKEVLASIKKHVPDQAIVEPTFSDDSYGRGERLSFLFSEDRITQEEYETEMIKIMTKNRKFGDAEN